MARSWLRHAGVAFLIVPITVWWVQDASTQSTERVLLSAHEGTRNGQWPSNHGALEGTHYSPLDQINRDNVSQLTVAWRFKMENFGSAPEVRPQMVPIMANGVLYFTAGNKRAVVAANPGSGEILWTWVLDEGQRARVAPRANSGRGVAYWTDGREERILVVTPGFRLVALNAATGQPVPTFGTNGIVDMMETLGVGSVEDHIGNIGSSSPPMIWNDTVIVGPALRTGFNPPSYKNTPGYVQAFDARTGKQLWMFHTVPKVGEYGADTWLNNSNEYSGNVGVWITFSVDPELGYVYLPVENATGDYYGGHRPGDNLFSGSIVCLDIRTGRRVWHYQITRHDIWDFDISSTPILADINVDGRPVKAVVVFGKQSYAYVFDRVTGEPVWPIVDQPVPQGDTPGEWYAPTQPIPTKPPAFDRVDVTPDEFIDFTPELRREALEVAKNFRYGPMYTPPSLVDHPSGTKGTIWLPGATGGALWENGVVDPESGIFYVGSTTNPNTVGLAKDPNSDMEYSLARNTPPSTVRGLPIVKPPYGQITAIDLNKGEILWQIPNSDGTPEIRNNPALKGVELGRLGANSRSPLLVTKTLLFGTEGGGGNPFFYAFDKQTGEIVWKTQTPAPGWSQPMTYMHQGAQYIVFAMASAAADMPAELIAYSLPPQARQATAVPVQGVAPPVVSAAEAAAGWQPLFDGRSLQGWWSQGRVRWQIEDGVLIGDVSRDPLPTEPGVVSTLLRTAAEYRDFELQTEFYAEKNTNSGIFIRCPARGSGASCYEFNIAENHAFPTGSIVNLFSTRPDVPMVSGRWNTIHILADGTRLVYTLNGKVTADVRDVKRQTGVIALQADGPNGPGPIRFRNMKIRVLG